MIRAVRTLISLVFLQLLLACGVQENFDEADAEINDFHYNYNNNEWDDIWSRTSPEFRKQQSKESFVNFLDGVKSVLGDELEGTQTGWNVNTTPMGTFTVVTKQTRFEKGEATEVFTFRIDDSRVEMVGYNINSQAMMDALMKDAARGRAHEKSTDPTP